MLPVSLRDLVGEMTMQNNDITGYLNRKTGKITLVRDEDFEALDDDADDAGLEDWELEARDEARQIVEDEDFLELPSPFDINEWDIMRRFAESRDNDAHCDRLLRAIRGSGAFRRFKDAVIDLDIAQAWYDYRDACYAETAIRWLKAYGIPFVNDMGQEPAV